MFPGESGAREQTERRGSNSGRIRGGSDLYAESDFDHGIMRDLKEIGRAAGDTVQE